MSEAPKLSLYRRLTRSVPILVTVIIHAVVVGIAGYLVTETIIGKKKTFVEVPPADTSFKKQVEHRLQVARKSGGGAMSSPVSAQRIISTATDALQLPEMPELPNIGANSLFNGGGFDANMGAVGLGPGYNTRIGGDGTGAGFMSMSFLGITNQRVSKIVFAVDVSLELMDIRKGGFQAFAIIRDQIMRLVSTLSPATEFNVILFERTTVGLFSEALIPSTTENKARFFEWMKSVNSNIDNLGIPSAKGAIPWKKVVPPNAGIDPKYYPRYWVNATHAALQLKPEIIFLITGNHFPGYREPSTSEKQDIEKQDKAMLALLKKDKRDMDTVLKARTDALTKAVADIREINKKQQAKGKDPFIAAQASRYFAADFIAAVHKAGYPEYKVDTKSWSTSDGKQIWYEPGDIITKFPADWNDVKKYISRLQNAFVRQTVALNIFYFVGPDFTPSADDGNLAKIASRYNGKFEILTTERLQQIQKASNEQAQKASDRASARNKNLGADIQKKP